MTSSLAVMYAPLLRPLKHSQELQPTTNARGETQGLILQQYHFTMLLTMVLRRLVKFYVQLLVKVRSGGGGGSSRSSSSSSSSKSL